MGRIALILLALLTVGASPPAQGDFATRILAAHNGERARLGIARLAWSPRLEREARVWATNLARRQRMEHARNRNGAGENLWMGAAGYFTPEQMIGGFIAERSNFRAGAFPDVSRTGDWGDVAHYTQLIWPGTRDVGCALVRGGRAEYLVCRYFPAGNVLGQRVP